MELSTQLLISLLATLAVLRWINLGRVISKHGDDRKVSKYNAYQHVFYTLILCWILYELNK